MTVCIDTNVVVQARASGHSFYPILDACVAGRLLRVNPQFQFRVIGDDLDDNMFTDCAITADADYLITEDRHFSVFAGSGYRPQPISPGEFLDHHRDICRV
jgi:predicted nucleic acid-binding protein